MRIPRQNKFRSVENAVFKIKEAEEPFSYVRSA